MGMNLRTEIDKAVKGFLADHFAKKGWQNEVVEDQTDPFNSGMLDSLALAEMVMHVEEKSGQEIDFLMIEPEEMSTVSSIVDAFTQASSMDALAG